MLAYDEETGEQAYKPAVQLFRNESKDWTGVTVNGKETISTPGHKYYLPEIKAWVSAEDLKVGYKVLTSDGEYATIEAVRPIHYETPQTTYNFEVETSRFVALFLCPLSHIYCNPTLTARQN